MVFLYLLYHTEAWTKWLPLCRQHFPEHVLKGNFCVVTKKNLYGNSVNQSWLFNSGVYVICIADSSFFAESSPEAKEMQRVRLVTGKNIFTQLTSVFEDSPTKPKLHSEGPVESVNSDGDTTIIHMPDPAEELKGEIPHTCRQSLDKHFACKRISIAMSVKVIGLLGLC